MRRIIHPCSMEPLTLLLLATLGAISVSAQPSRSPEVHPDGRVTFRLFAASQKLDASLTARGIQHVWHPTPGIHNFPVWRRNLAEFAPRLFW
jgi:S-formylglutathione hydrolase FrmB